MFYIYRERVKPTRVEEYEALTRTLVARIDGAPFSERVRFTTVSGPKLGYAYVAFVAGFTGLGAFRRDLAALLEDTGAEAWHRFERAAGEAVERAEAYVTLLRSELSYLPDAVALDAELPYRHYRWLHARPGHRAEVESLLRRAVELAWSRELDRGWRVYDMLLGDDLPCYLLVQRAADEADHQRGVAAVWHALGCEGRALARRGRRQLRRVQRMGGWIRPELSFPPGAPRPVAREPTRGGS